MDTCKMGMFKDHVHHMIKDVRKEGASPGSPSVKILCFCCRAHGFDPWSEN